MKKKSKIIIIAILIIIVAFVALKIIYNKKEDNKIKDNNTNTSEQIEMKVKPDGEPNQELIDAIKGERKDEGEKPKEVKVMMEDYLK